MLPKHLFYYKLPRNFPIIPDYPVKPTYSQFTQENPLIPKLPIVT